MKNEDKGNVGMMSESAYNNLGVNLDMMNNPVHYQHILNSVHQMQTGHTKTFTDQEWEQLLHEQGIF